MKNITFGFGFWLACICILVVAFTVWVFATSQKVKDEKVSTETSRKVALGCTTDMATQFHIHPQLKIIILGKERVIPAEIGIQPTCMTSIHTHSADGIIHIEAPVKKDFTLGDFFAVWGQPFMKEEVLDTKVTSGNQVLVSVNGKTVDTFDQTILRDKDQIVIEVK